MIHGDDVLFEWHVTLFECDQVKHIYYMLYRDVVHLTHKPVDTWRCCIVGVPLSKTYIQYKVSFLEP
jgi:hypothetical protein